MEVGWRAYQKIGGPELPPKPDRNAFLRGRPLVRTGQDFYLLFKLLEQEPEADLGQIPWSRFCELRELYQDEAERFHLQFYQLRTHYRDTQPALWFSWQGPYPDVVAFLDRWESKFVGIALATTKDARSAEVLLEQVGRRWPIFGKEVSLDKGRQLELIAGHFGVLLEEVLFLDDLLENLLQAERAGVYGALAAWGYNTEYSRREAARRGFPVWQVSDLERYLTEDASKVEAS